MTSENAMKEARNWKEGGGAHLSYSPAKKSRTLNISSKKYV